ncbi:phytanoyl-CoA dioxygenase family protein [Streptomyces sp. NPDC003247]|uniref:phytanoyl-CoA dioxygenase family protein n=1 Tax=Streptomyces sp. NPDC003247 TaxID=3364677 RepID=UPI0036890C24
MADADTPRPVPGELTEEQRRTLDRDGYLVLPDVLSTEECDLLSKETDDIWERERGAEHKYVEEAGVRFTDNLLRHSTLFERVLTEPAVLAGVRAVLGADIRLSLINGRRADPGHGNQPLHDLKRRRGKPFRWCNTIWCLDPFTERNGTRVIPGSHLEDERFLARLEDPKLIHPDERTVVAPRGAVVVFNSHLIHGGSTNREDTARRCIHGSFAAAGEPTFYNWHELPQAVKEGLAPGSLALLGLAPEPSRQA